MLRGGGAHLGFHKILAGVPAKIRGMKPRGAEHTLWQILEHLRIAQWDILEFSRNSKHISPDFPSGCWPPTAAPPSDKAWKKSISAFRADLNAMCTLVKNPKTSLFARIPWGDGQTILREAMLVADHNAYHLGEFVLLRRLLASWPTE
ncbi:MAG: DinB family protein [Acidobacteria bacterium]|nr:DinB family protein [Acidobacteriota bacterium]